MARRHSGKTSKNAGEMDLIGKPGFERHFSGRTTSDQQAPWLFYVQPHLIRIRR
jgi:hypothetical protein